MFRFQLTLSITARLFLSSLLDSGELAYRTCQVLERTLWLFKERLIKAFENGFEIKSALLLKQCETIESSKKWYMIG